VADSLIRIQGAGPVGIMAALFLVKYGWSRSAIQIIDPALDAAQPAAIDDPRILALSQGTLSRLTQLGLDCHPVRIQEIHVSSQGQFGSMQIKSENAGLAALGGLVPYSQLLEILRSRLRAEGISMAAAADTASPEVHIIAEGGLYQSADPSLIDSGMQVVRDYQQQAVIGWVQTQLPTGATAYERFTADGAVALLPMHQRYALIWCAAADHAQTFFSADSIRQCEMIENVMGGRLGRIRNVSLTGSYPLGLKWRERLVDGNTVWIGNSAQALHPIAGQGLNLGFRDAETLSACLLQRGRPIAERLLDYAQRRKTDRWAVRTATDTLARAAWVRRSIGAMTFIPGAKRLLGQVLMFGG
jgi:2-octaprenyl-6-methoxyphenol hydroxylase